MYNVYKKWNGDTIMGFDFNLYEEHYHTTLIADGTWMISSKTAHTPWGSDNYLLEGDEFAVVIDSGMTKLDFYAYCKQFTSLPIHGVINTHSHFDHTGGNGYFKNVYMHPLAEKGAKTPFGGNAADYPLDYKITPVGDGFTINLGNRVLEVIEIGAHDLSSIAILDRDRRILFSGDELESGWCNVGIMGPKVPGQTIENHYKNMLKLKERFSEFDVICPGHHGAPLHKDLLNHVLIADKMILDGYEGDPNIPDKNGGGRFKDAGNIRAMRYKMAHICYNIEHIFED